MPRLSKVYSAFLTRTIVRVESALYEVLPTAHYLGSVIYIYHDHPLSTATATAWPQPIIALP